MKLKVCNENSIAQLDMKAISSKVILEVSRYRYFLSKLLKNFRKHLMSVICFQESYYDCFELKEKLWLVFFPPGGNLGYQRQSGQRGISLVRDTVLPFFGFVHFRFFVYLSIREFVHLDSVFVYLYSINIKGSHRGREESH